MMVDILQLSKQMAEPSEVVDKRNEKKLKIVLLGDRSVGKSSIVHRFTTDQFTDQTKSTVGVDFTSKAIKFNGVSYKIQLWDTAGQEKYRSLIKSYLKTANACIFVYDSKDSNSYKNLVDWIEAFDSSAVNQAYKIVVANKQDLDMKDPENESRKAKIKKEFPQLAELKEIFASAKTGYNIEEIFEQVLQNIDNKKLGVKSEKVLGLQSVRTIKSILENKKQCFC